MKLITTVFSFILSQVKKQQTKMLYSLPVVIWQYLLITTEMFLVRREVTKNIFVCLYYSFEQWRESMSESGVRTHHNRLRKQAECNKAGRQMSLWQLLGTETEGVGACQYLGELGHWLASLLNSDLCIQKAGLNRHRVKRKSKRDPDNKPNHNQ